MKLWHKLVRRLSGARPELGPDSTEPAGRGDRGIVRAALNAAGWDDYARNWEIMRRERRLPDVAPARHGEVAHIGDEWALVEDTPFPYGFGGRTIQDFLDHIERRLLRPYLPSGAPLKILEIGPGGGRLTQLLLPRAEVLYAVDVSAEMLAALRSRCAGLGTTVCVLTDGRSIPGVPRESIDAVLSLEAFHHIDPWGIFRYLQLSKELLRRGGIGIIHFPDVETEVGFRMFEAEVPEILQVGVTYGSNVVMSKGIMRTFLERLGFETVALDNQVLPRDAVAVFRKP